MRKSSAVTVLVIGRLCTVVSALFALQYEAMIHFHLLFVDYPNPNRRGLKGVTVSTGELVRVLAVTAGLIALVAIAWRAVRRMR